MGKTSRKTHSEVEHLKGEIKQLKSINRQLKKRLSELERKEHHYEDLIDEVVENTDVSVDYDLCQECGKGILNIVDLKHIIIESCNVCDYRRKLEPR